MFRLGDNRASATSCGNRVHRKAVKGNTFYFDFEVLQDNTSVDVLVADICGVDYIQSNSIGFGLKDNVPQEKYPTTPGMREYRFSPKTLNRGQYRITIKSRPNPAENNDSDDFIVGDVRIKASTDVRAIGVGATYLNDPI